MNVLLCFELYEYGHFKGEMSYCIVYTIVWGF